MRLTCPLALQARLDEGYDVDPDWVLGDLERLQREMEENRKADRTITLLNLPPEGLAAGGGGSTADSAGSMLPPEAGCRTEWLTPRDVEVGMTFQGTHPGSPLPSHTFQGERVIERQGVI